MATQFIPPGGLPANTPVGTDGATLGSVVEQVKGAVQTSQANKPSGYAQPDENGDVANPVVGNVPPLIAASPLDLKNWRIVNAGPRVWWDAANPVPEGYIWDGTHNYTIQIGAIEKRNDDASWSLIASNTSPFSGVTGSLQPTHLADGDYYNGKLYIPAEAWAGCGNTTESLILVYDADSLQLVQQVSTTGETGALAIDAANGLLYTVSYCDGTTLKQFDLATLVLKQTITLSSSIPFMQGAAFSPADGLLYVNGSDPSLAVAADANVQTSAMNPTLFTINPATGAVTQLYTSPLAGENEGLAWKNGLLGWLVRDSNSANYSRVTFFAPPNFQYGSPTLRGDAGGRISLGPVDAFEYMGAHSVFGSWAIGSDFFGRFPMPENSLAVSNKLMVGTMSADGCQVHIVGRQPKTWGTIFRLTNKPILYKDASTGCEGFFGMTEPSWGIGGGRFVFGAGAGTYAPSSANVQMCLWSGNLGIGNTSPEYKLDVSGPIRATGGLIASVDASSAASGVVGEYLTNTATGTSLTSGTITGAVTIQLSAGDWDVQGVATFMPASGVTTTGITAGINTITDLPAHNTGGTVGFDGLSSTSGAALDISTPTVRVNVSATTTVYMMVKAVFSGGNMTCDAFVRARRVR